MNTHINEALQDFLTNPHNENKILVIKGKWGVGKTYFWTDFYKTHESLLEQQFPTYSYVSLFGQQAINDVRNTILNNLEIINEKKYKKIISSWKAKKRVLKKLINFIFCNNFLQKYLWSNTKPFSESIYCNHLICFDDIERIDPKFPIETLMGYCDELAQQKNCKIILIFNEDELEETQRNAFNKYREKVVDIELTYSPTLNEQLRIVFGDKLEKYPIIHQVINKQEHVNIVIKNIRVLKKINQIIDDFIKIAQNDLHPLVIEDFIKRTIYWSNYFYIQNDQLSFEMLKNPPIIDLKQKLFINQSTEEKQKDEECPSEKLYNQAYTLAIDLRISDTSTFTEEIIHKLEHGVWSEENIKSFISSETDRIDIIIKKKEIDQRLDEAWKLYHSSFQNNLTDIIKIFKQELDTTDNYSYWDFLHFIRTLNSYYQFQKLENIMFESPTNYIETYMAINTEQLATLSSKDRLYIEINTRNIDSEIRDYTIKKLDEFKLQKFKVPLSKFITTLNDDLSSEQVTYIQDLTLSEIEDWLKNLDDPLMWEYINMLRHASAYVKNELSTIDPNTDTLINQALKNIADSNPLNKFRIDRIIKSRF